MTGTNVITASSISPQVLVSQQLGTTEAALYTVPAGSSAKISHGVLCNVTGTMPAPALTLGALATQSNIVAPTLAAPTTSTTGGTLAAATYYYVATTTTAFGETAKSAEVSQVTTGTTSTVTLSWAAITGSTGTKIYRGTAAGAENVLVATVTGTSWTDTGAAGTTATPPTAATSSAVFWKVSAKNTAGETLPSSEVTATVAGNQSAPLSWGAVTGAVSYNVFRGTSAGNENILVANVTGTSYSDLGNVGTSQSPVTTQTTATSVLVYLSVLASGQTLGGNTHRVINAYNLAANDTLSLANYIANASLGPGDLIAGYAQYGGAVTAIITGTVHA
ncbi:hypothetical protein ACFFGR_09135 [Arthrobacter liuii]|uniref:Fibronectin type-III domain-containing protein n=1 Tax=Arthrobacter liuii TaxID=1476996 RepID=A0ABQ2AQT3_9MICC|nr:hypothetical protein [Arthrobacter liuii]GGH93724.1 hypothetical protein GCM10007170_15260 [Arthrobacter liuii]